MVLIRVHRDHDLVLEFDSLAARKKFLNKMEGFLSGLKKHLIIVQVSDVVYFIINLRAFYLEIPHS